VELLFVLGVGLAAGTISGIVGFGSSIMLMPVLRSWVLIWSRGGLRARAAGSGLELRHFQT
jgi:uncharacterized membrane protein YfcA